jgi:hypothetical protein
MDDQPELLLSRDDVRLQDSADIVRQTKKIVSFSKQEIEGMKKTISYTQEAIARTRKLLQDQQS